MMQLRALVRTPAALRGLRRPAAHVRTPPPTHTHTRLQTRQQPPHAIWQQTRAYTATIPPAEPTAGMRHQALASLTACVDAGDILGTYRVAHAMRSTSLLATPQGHATQHVLQDALVTGHLTRAVAQHHDWEESASLVDLIVEMRPVGLGRQPRDARFVRTGKAAGQADAGAAGRLAGAVLSARYGGLPERRLAGLTAQQILADYDVPEGQRRVLRLRAEGFASRGRGLRRLLAGMGELQADERFEAGVAHARCLNLPEAEALLSPHLAAPETPQGREALAALALCVAETGDLRRALQMAEAVGPGEEALRLRLWIARAGALAVVPRRPFSQPFHTLASAHRSSVYVDGLAGLVERAFGECREGVRLAEAGVGRRLEKLVFSAECADALAAQMAAQGVTRDSPCAAALAHAFGSAPLRQFLWAQQFDATLLLHPLRKQRLMLSHVDHACSVVPGYFPSAADLQPALVGCLPPGVWTQEPRGNFRDDAAFEAADGFLLSGERTLVDPAALNLLAKAQAVLRDGRLGRAGHAHVLVLCTWLLVAHGDVRGALGMARRALAAAPVALEDGALALRHVRSPAFFSALLPALSTARPLAAYALAHVLPHLPSTLSPRLASAVLRCCATARNASVALDVVRRLPSAPSAKVRELLVRALLRGGHVRAGLGELRSLCYGARGTAPGDWTFAVVVGVLAEARGSVRGAEHAFDAWVRVAGHQGRVGAALAEHYAAVGITRDARVTLAKSPFVPPSGGSPEEALASLGDPSVPRRFAERGFLRLSELRVVVALVCGYVRCGLGERAGLWEAWLVGALCGGRLRVRPEVVACLARVQRRRVAAGRAEDVRACLALMVAVDCAVGGRLADRPSLRVNQEKVFGALGERARADPSMLTVIADYLAHAGAPHLLRHIVDTGMDPN
ncbi:hypothetical protein GGI15_004706 [Coemansia interrupta]|uniref:Uncharacterized protein n=1 Tax=Coemansia interrupta TaxID=1126814 RepID=A0A9W8LE99_9FUNG|nr:hypothetical protein GGI15_004706 [Coemansia interrupta]